MAGAVVGPLMMLAVALKQPGTVKTLHRAGATSPESARKAGTLGLPEPPLQPLIRARVVIREPDGRIWLDAAAARRRQWRIGAVVGAAVLVVSGILALILTH